MELSKVKTLYQNLGLVGEFLESRGNTPDMEISSLPVLNKKIWGVGRKKLMIIASRPSHGKSSLAMQIAWDVSKSHNVLVLSLEQTIEETAERMFCNVMRVNNLELLRGGFNKYKKEWDTFCKMVGERHLIVTEQIGKTWMEIEELTTNMARYPDLLVLDYIQCISSKGLKKMEAIDEYILYLRNLAIEKNFGVLLCSQINRQNVGQGGGEPTLTGIKGSGYLEELGDKILLLHWDAHQNHSADLNKYTIIIAKNKGGRTGYLDCRFDPQHYKFSDSMTEEEVGVEDLQELKKTMELFDGTVHKIERKDWHG